MKSTGEGMYNTNLELHQPHVIFCEGSQVHEFRQSDIETGRL